MRSLSRHPALDLSGDSRTGARAVQQTNIETHVPTRGVEPPDALDRQHAVRPIRTLKAEFFDRRHLPQARTPARGRTRPPRLRQKEDQESLQKGRQTKPSGALDSQSRQARHDRPPATTDRRRRLHQQLQIRRQIRQ